MVFYCFECMKMSYKSKKVQRKLHSFLIHLFVKCPLTLSVSINSSQINFCRMHSKLNRLYAFRISVWVFGCNSTFKIFSLHTLFMLVLGTAYIIYAFLFPFREKWWSKCRQQDCAFQTKFLSVTVFFEPYFCLSLLFVTISVQCIFVVSFISSIRSYRQHVHLFWWFWYNARCFVTKLIELYVLLIFFLHSR